MNPDDKQLKKLSERDLSVLEHIFDFGAENSINSNAKTEEQNPCPKGSGNAGASVAPKLEIDADTLSKIKALEIEAVQIAEKGTSAPESSPSFYLESISKFSEILDLCQGYASAWNNRAQAHRMAGQVEKALSDLDQAIHYGHLIQDSRTLSQAYTQRGLLKKSRANPEDTAEVEAAASDLENGAKYGNSLAKKLAVAENPYAKMCSAMVKEMLTKLE